MGSYATLHFFQKLIDAFPAQKEWQRPRIIVDNNCVLPSRVRAILYGENREVLVRLLADAIRHLLVDYSVDTLLLACNTSHCFLPEIRRLVMIPEGVLVDLIQTVAHECENRQMSAVYVIATEGMIAARVYDDYCQARGIAVAYPASDEQKTLREFIENVKQSKWDDLTDRFAEYLDSLACENVVLGCTEFSVIADAMKDPSRIGKNLIDPVQLAVDAIRERVLRK
jgi:aspartate racemase